jgi:dimethylargininase
MHFTRAIVRLPSLNFASGLTTAGLGAPNYGRALEQHSAYCAALERCGLTVTRLEPDEGHPDSTFVEDTAVVITGQTPELSFATLTRPGAPSRVGEIESMADLLKTLFLKVHSIKEPGTLDGGDVCQAGNHFFVGLSERTNESGSRQLSESLMATGYTVTLVDIRGGNRLLHLKSGLAFLGDNHLVVTDELADLSEFRGYELLRVRRGEDYGANCVRVNEHVLIASGFPLLAAGLKDRGYKTIALEVSEFQKMDGGLSCLSLRY